VAFDISLWQAALWSAVSSVIVLSASEFLSPYYGKIGLIMDPKRMRNVGVALGALFFLFIGIHIGTTIR